MTDEKDFEDDDDAEIKHLAELWIEATDAELDRQADAELEQQAELWRGAEAEEERRRFAEIQTASIFPDRDVKIMLHRPPVDTPGKEPGVEREQRIASFLKKRFAKDDEAENDGDPISCHEGRVYTAYLADAGFTSPEHLAAFYAAGDHAKACSICGPDAEGNPGHQCEESRELGAATTQAYERGLRTKAENDKKEIWNDQGQK